MSATGNTIAATSAPFLVGGISSQASNTPTGTFKGQIDEVRVFDHALDAAAVQALYASTVNPVPEPGEWAMMFAGLAVIAGVARRRLPLSFPEGLPPSAPTSG